MRGGASDDTGTSSGEEAVQDRVGLAEFEGGRKVDVRLPEKGNSNTHGARRVHLIITMIKWIRTRRLSIKNSLSEGGGVRSS